MATQSTFFGPGKYGILPELFFAFGSSREPMLDLDVDVSCHHLRDHLRRLADEVVDGKHSRGRCKLSLDWLGDLYRDRRLRDFNIADDSPNDGSSTECQV